MAITKEIEINVAVDDKELTDLESSLKSVGKTAEKTGEFVGSLASDNTDAMTELDNITGGLGSKFVEVGKAAKLSGRAMRTALISSGIGLAVVALGLIVEHWDSIVDFITDSNDELEDQRIALEKNLKLNKESGKVLDSSLTVLAAREKLFLAEGKSTTGILKIRRQLLEAQFNLNIQAAHKLATQLQEERSTLNQLINTRAINKAIIERESGGTVTREETEAEKAQKVLIQDLERRLNLANAISLQTRAVIVELNKPIDLPAGPKKEEEGREKIEGPTLADELQSARDLADGLLAITKDSSDKTLEILQEEELKKARISLDASVKKAGGEAENSQKSIDDDKDAEAQKLANRKSVANASIQISQNTLGIVGALAKEGSDLSKGIAASQATINTFQGITAALSAPSVIPDPFGTILKFTNAAVVGVTGAINVQKILSTKPVTTSAPDVGGGGGGGIAAPSFNIVEGTGTNQIAEGLAATSKPPKVQIVAEEMSTQQALDRKIESDAAF